MAEDKLPPEMKRAAVGLIIMILGYIAGSAGFFYLLYLLFMTLHRRR